MEVTDHRTNANFNVLIHAFSPGPEGQGTHKPYLLRAILGTTGPILELGVGEHSTPALHLASVLLGRRVASYDNTERWVQCYAGLRTRTHSIDHVSSYDAVPCQARPWDVALVDQAPSADRGKILPRLTHVPLVICHDSEDPHYGYEDAFRGFRYMKTFKRLSPWTTVVSNIHDVTQWDGE